MEAIINFKETRLKTMHVIDELQSHDSVIRRLKHMREERQRKHDGRDPFRKTFLEKIRDVLSGGMDGRQHWLRSRLHWWAGEDWRKTEIQQEIDKQVKLSNKQTILNDDRGVAYGVEILDACALGYDAVHSTDEYLNLLRESVQDISSDFNNMDFSINESEAINLTDGTTPVPELKRLSATEIKDSHKKSTTELFLSVHNYVLEKEEAKQTTELELEKKMKQETTSEKFAGTKLWEQSEDYLPGEKWDPSELSFEPLSTPRIDDSQIEPLCKSASEELFSLIVAAQAPSVTAP